MSTAFPAALDVLANPAASDPQDSVTVPHATQHANANDAIEALQAKVGINASTDPSSLDYKIAGKAAAAHNHSGIYEPVDANIARVNATQSWTAEQTFKEVKDTVHTIVDGPAFEIDPANGSVQVVTLGAARTPAATNFESGQTLLLGIDDGAAYAITWTTVAPTWVKPGGTATAPTLATAGYTWVLLWKVGSTIYGAEVGKP